MAYFSTCPKCGCSLDPGEKCDCEEVRVTKKKSIQNMFVSDKYGQMMIRFPNPKEGERTVEKSVV